MGIGQDIPDEKQAPVLSWSGAVPVADAFDDPYFSVSGGLAEAEHVFLRGNDLPTRLTDGFQIAELGFGTGLNALAVAQAWTGPGRIRFASFEAFPMDLADMARALSAFPKIARFADELLRQWPASRIRIGAVDLTVIRGDARRTLPEWEGMADAWFLDGFSPARNPELWGDVLMEAVARHTAPGGTFATYTAAGHVRRALDAAGFAVERVPGYARKRHMTKGVLR
ncbi:MAG: tRNA (5-methylaminomethyl-2-thiouridine)(34)-methyltransferase MnmD [Jannaschia sp.]